MENNQPEIQKPVKKTLAKGKQDKKKIITEETNQPKHAKIDASISENSNPKLTRYPVRHNKKPDYYESDVSNSEEEAEPMALHKGFETPDEAEIDSIILQQPPKSDDEESIASSTSIDPNLIDGKYIESRELIQCRPGNVAYFVDTHGEPCDTESKKLVEFNKIPKNQEIDINEVQQIIKKNGKCYYPLCIRGKGLESLTAITQNISIILRILKELLIKNKQREISIAKSQEIEQLNWNKVETLIKKAFHNSGIDVVICTGTLRYVLYEKRDEIFYELHKSPIGGHWGVSKTYNRIKQDYYWENLKDDIQRRIQQCLNCQLKKLTRLKTKQPMIITDTPGATFDKVAMDIVGPLPRTENGYEYILTIQDQLAKFCIAVPLQNTLASTIADAFIKRFICIFGAPKIVLTDQGKNFLSNLMARVAKRFKIKKIRTTAFHPQSNGSLERSHHALGQFLKQYTDKDNEWDMWLELAILNYNTCVQESTKHTPYEVVFGRLARLPSNDPLKEADMLPTYQGYVQNLVTRLNGIQKLVYDNLVSSKHKSKKYYDKNINPQNFTIGDFVFLLSGPKPGKFGDHYTGPHKILEVLNKHNFKIQTSKGTKIVHANRLRISHINKEEKLNKKKKHNINED